MEILTKTSGIDLQQHLRRRRHLYRRHYVYHRHVLYVLLIIHLLLPINCNALKYDNDEIREEEQKDEEQPQPKQEHQQRQQRKDGTIEKIIRRNEGDLFQAKGKKKTKE